jgi:DNA helicase-2/ATP-dependent DNA helicase PcrA
MNEREYRVIGPPGTGKTNYLCRQIERAVQAERTPLLTSLTKAAAFEIGARVEYGWTFGESQVGTLHAHCFRALDCPALISKKEHVDSWNDYVESFDPGFRLSLDPFGTSQADEGIGAEKVNAARGDAVYEQTLNLRAMMKPEADWPTELLAFDRKFREWKRLENLNDFTDLIERCRVEVPTAPHDPDVIFVDEAQDHDRLELSLVRKWANSPNVDRIVIAGDPDQNLYSFRGAEPEAFYAQAIPPENEIVLSQSYRVPRAVHAVAQSMIRRIEERRDVRYEPTDEPGEVVRRKGLSLRHPHLIVKEAERIAASGETVMILGSCRYLLNGVLSSLRAAGVPFANPYAPNNGAFNPLSVRGGITSPQRLLAYLRAHETFFGEESRLWTWGEFASWIDPIDTKGFLRHGMKKKIADVAASQETAVMTEEALSSFLDEANGPAELEAIDADPLGWYRERLNASRAKTFEYPIEVVRHHSVTALQETPKIIVGTIHSVKGGEADNVFLFPDLSMQGQDEHERNPAAIVRAYYVGITRAKKRLELFDASRRSAIDWRD